MTVKRQTLTVRETARRLGTSETTVRKGVAAGNLPGVALEGEHQSVYIIPEEGVREFLRTGRAQGEKGAPAIANVCEVDLKPRRESDATTERPNATLVLTGWAYEGEDAVTRQPIVSTITIHQDGTFPLQVGTETFVHVATVTLGLEALIFSN